MEAIIITGLSGAGKSLAVDCFEDMGYYCIDNLPPSLIKDFIALIRRGKSKINKSAFVVDIRGGAFFDDLSRGLSDLDKEGVTHRVLFLDASDEVLLRRFNESRRAHPLSAGTTNAEGIKAERERLKPLKGLADWTIDTSALNNAALVRKIRELISEKGFDESFRFIIQSFGYKFGLPLDADIVFDVRFIPNPFYVDGLRELTGNDYQVLDYVMSFDDSAVFADRIMEILKDLKPSYLREGKNVLNVTFGCTGGRHRSVTIANVVARRLETAGEEVTLRHRDIEENPENA